MSLFALSQIDTDTFDVSFSLSPTLSYICQQNLAQQAQNLKYSDGHDISFFFVSSLVTPIKGNANAHACGSKRYAIFAQPARNQNKRQHVSSLFSVLTNSPLSKHRT